LSDYRCCDQREAKGLCVGPRPLHEPCEDYSGRQRKRWQKKEKACQVMKAVTLAWEQHGSAFHRVSHPYQLAILVGSNSVTADFGTT
jgi:hypothetical protein